MFPDRLRKFFTGPTYQEVNEALSDFKRMMQEKPEAVFTGHGGPVIDVGGIHHYKHWGRQRYAFLVPVNRNPTSRVLKTYGLPKTFEGIPVNYRLINARAAG